MQYALKPILVHPITGEPKRCFLSSGGDILFCNFTERAGKIWRFSKIKDFLPIPIKWRCKRPKYKDGDFNKKKYEPFLREARISS